MESAFAWIGHFAEWFAKWIPRLVIVEVTQGGIRMRRGHEVSEITPGPIVHWPVLTPIKIITVVRDTYDLPAQTFTTKDGKVTLASGMITYSVRDVVKLLTTAPDYVNAIADITMTCIHDVFIQYEWEELRQGILDGSVGKALRKSAQDELSVFGIKVITVGLKDLAPARVLKVVQDV